MILALIILGLCALCVLCASAFTYWRFRWMLDDTVLDAQDEWLLERIDRKEQGE